MDNKLLQTNFLKVLKENKDLRKKVEMLEKEVRHLRGYMIWMIQCLKLEELINVK
jgi:hypothetical protein